MSKAKTNALDALRALIAERQQYEQWLSTLDARKEGTPEHVYERVRGDYRGRLERVVSDIRGHAEELQLSISTLSSRLVEVAREEDTKREALQEAELRAAVGEYEPAQWDQLRTDAEESLKKIAVDRESLDNQLSELRSIQKLSEATGQATESDAQAPTGLAPSDSVVVPMMPQAPEPPASTKQEAAPAVPQPADAVSPGEAPASPQPGGHRSGTAAAPSRPALEEPPPAAASSTSTPSQERLPLEPVAAAASSPAGVARPRPAKSPPGGIAAVRSKSEGARPDAAKTLKCPECGTPNYPTEWYCERCGGELATM